MYSFSQLDSSIIAPLAPLSYGVRIYLLVSAKAPMNWFAELEKEEKGIGPELFIYDLFTAQSITRDHYGLYTCLDPIQ